ncbi:MAG: hypothetical protein ACYDG2_22000, partial [Ruminiclostridium sp.]
KTSTRINHWPADASSLSRHLNKIKHNLEKFGIVFEHDREKTKARTRIIKLSLKEFNNMIPSESSNVSSMNNLGSSDVSNCSSIKGSIEEAENIETLQDLSISPEESRERMLQQLDGTDGLDDCDNIPINTSSGYKPAPF